MTMLPSQSTAGPEDRLSSLAHTARERFVGKNLSVRGSHVVHAVDRERWVAGLLVPQPLCHTAVYGWSPDAMHAVTGTVTCLRCRRMLTPDEVILPGGTYQPPLFSARVLQPGGLTPAA
jgi:hypothetical protein